MPAILEYLPYRKRWGTHDRDALTHPYLAGHGYASVRVDIRGSGESEGLLFDEYTAQEQDDALGGDRLARGAAVVQRGGRDDGHLVGRVQRTPGRRPPGPALKAIVSIVLDRRSLCRRRAFHGRGAAGRSRNSDGRRSSSARCAHPPDPVLVGEQMARDVARAAGERAAVPRTLAAASAPGCVLAAWFGVRGLGGDPVPRLRNGEWTDGYTNAIPRLLEHLTVPCKGLIGPWAHAYPHFALPGPQIGFLQEALRWWDHWLKGEPGRA